MINSEIMIDSNYWYVDLWNYFEWKYEKFLKVIYYRVKWLLVWNKYM